MSPPEDVGEWMTRDGSDGYYGRPVLKEPAWTIEVPWYLFAGGLAGASSVLAATATAAGDRRLAQAAARAAALGGAVSPVLLISDLGRPSRFLNMLRLFKVTSPLSVGSWVLVIYGPAAVARALLGEPAVAAVLARRVPPLGSPVVLRSAGTAAAVLGPVLSVYTGVLLANTAIPVWHAARRELPAVFAASSAASAGAAAILLGGDGPAPRRLAATGASLELAATTVMERRLGDLAAPYHEGTSGRWATISKGAMAAGIVALSASRSRPWLARLGAATILAGSLSQRFAVFKAGFASARATARMPTLR